MSPTDIDYYRKSVYTYLRRSGAGIELAEDLTQETLLQALNHMNPGHTNVQGWLNRTAKNFYLQHLRVGMNKEVLIEPDHPQISTISKSDPMISLVDTIVAFQQILKTSKLNSKRKRFLYQRMISFLKTTHGPIDDNLLANIKKSTAFKPFLETFYEHASH